MAHDESAKSGAETQEDESVLTFLIGIVQQNGPVVKEDGLRLFEGNAMFAPILGALAFVPLEAQVPHADGL